MCESLTSCRTRSLSLGTTGAVAAASLFSYRGFAFDLACAFGSGTRSGSLNASTVTLEAGLNACFEGVRWRNLLTSALLNSFSASALSFPRDRLARLPACIRRTAAPVCSTVRSNSSGTVSGDPPSGNA